MSQKWNLQDIRPAGAKKVQTRIDVTGTPRQDISARRPRVQVPEDMPRDPDVSTIDILDGNSEKRKRVFISITIVLVILVVGFFINTLMGGAEVIVYPKYKDVTVQATFTAKTDPQVDELSYELLTLEASGERQVTAKGEEKVSERATGKITIYNTYSTAPQRLIKNTRFATPEGLVFRINESVEVPGSTKDAKGAIVPGEVAAEVFADGTGEQYNIKPTRFLLPGLAGSEQYEKIYAESIIDFTGGYEGMKFVMDEAEFKTTEQALQLELRDALLTRLEKERPAGFVLYDSAVTFHFVSLPATEYGNGMATIKEEAKLQVPIFKEAEFADYLARSTVKGFEKSPVELPNPQTLKFSYVSPTTTSSDISQNTSIEFNLRGDTRLIWTFDAEKLKADIATLSKTALPAIVNKYPAITKFEAKVKPFWKQSFPDDVKNIEVTTVVPETPQN